MRTNWLIGCAAFNLLLTGAGCNEGADQTRSERPEAAHEMPTTTGTAGEDTTASEHGAAQAAEADRMFIDEMVPHHEMALMMAEDALAKANTQELKSFAQKVKDDQAREIAQMKSWRKDWFGSEATPPMDHSGMKPIPAGPDYDRMWAQEMIVHHQGAIDMSNQRQAALARPELKELAQRIITAQKQEQEQLNGYIQTWSATAAQ